MTSCGGPKFSGEMPLGTVIHADGWCEYEWLVISPLHKLAEVTGKGWRVYWLNNGEPSRRLSFVKKGDLQKYHERRK